MAQYDVHRNLGASRDRVPFIVIVQSAQFDGYYRRVVVPLVRADALGPITFPSFNPTFSIGRTKVVLHPLEIVSISRAQLGPRVGSLSDRAEDIVGALDELLSRSWG